MVLCAAEDCTNEAKIKYCSNSCKWRQAARSRARRRVKAGLCAQCGGEMDSPVSPHRNKVSPKYCSKCQLYFHVRYEVQKEKSDSSV